MTSRAPSPIASLMWHASSSKQKSDMLATQTADGDLRVWSVSKPPTAEAPRVIRVLRRQDPQFMPGRTWISWSKNGRILQFSETETCAWDVRTKHVTFEPLPIVDGIRAMAAYGPTATIFSLGPDHTVQQYDAENYQLVRNVRHVPSNLPPTPPEDNRPWTTSESDEEVRSPGGRSRPDQVAYDQSRKGRASPRSQAKASHSARPSRQKDLVSPAVRSELTGTTFSAGTQPSAYHFDNQKFVSPVSARSARKSSRLKQEVIPSPHERPIDDLFPFIRARLSDVPYRPPRTDATRMTPDDLRNQMLSTVFGWEEDVWELIRDELSRHPAESQHSILLSRWLDEDPDYLNAVLGASGAISNVDWMILALGTIDHQASSKKISQAFIEKMLSRGDIHAAATVLLAIGDKSDAIEVYVSRNQFLEAVLLTCLVSPSDWQRQSHLVRRWGEHVVEKSEQQLAIRCFSCTTHESTEPWTSPTAQMAVQSAGGMNQALHDERPTISVGEYPDIYKKTLQRRRTLDAPTPIAMPAPPPIETVPTPIRTAQHSGSRITPQSSALKLITSFGPSATQQYKFPGLKSDDHTPTHGAMVTPIAESAIDRSALSPGGAGSYRLNNIRSLNNAMSARTPSAFHRQRLPSIGETPIDVDAPSSSQIIKGKRSHRALATAVDGSSEKSRPRDLEIQEPQSAHPALTLLTPARYDPKTPARETPQTALPPTAVKTTYRPRRFSNNDANPADGEKSRGSSRNRKPDGLSIQMFPVTETSQASSKPPQTSYSTTQIDTSTSDWTSPPTTGNTHPGIREPTNAQTKSIEEYISSLQQAQLYTQHSDSRTQSSSSRNTGSEKRSRHGHHRTSEDLRGRDDRRTIPASKRSPSSPVPMSPEDIRMFSVSVESLDAYARAGTPGSQPSLGRRPSRSGKESKRHRSKSSQVRNGSRAASNSRQPSPDPSQHSYHSRGRSNSRKRGSGRRSPSSPLPMLPSEEDRNSASESAALRLVSADRRNRSTSAQGSRERSRDHPKNPRTRSGSRQAEDRDGTVSRRSSVSTRGDKKHRRRREPSNPRSENNERLVIDPQHIGTNNSLPPQEAGEISATPSLSDRRKELAAAELEARRLSLARRPSAPIIPLPGQNANNLNPISEQAPPLIRAVTEDLLTNKAYGETRPRRTSTPRAMQVLPSLPTENTAESDTNETLPSSVYMTPNPSVHASSPPPSAPLPNQAEFESIIAQLPRHPAYDTNISQSRSSSKSRDARDSSQSRHTSRERKIELLSRSPVPNTREYDMNGSFRNKAPPPIQPPPPILPELQHLATPPIPPPAPYAPPNANGVPEYDNGTHLQRPSSRTGSGNTNARPGSPLSPSGHRRGRSGNGGDGSFAGKFRSLTERMRSTSRGRDNLSKSPPIGYEGVVPMPYETVTDTGQRRELVGRLI